MGEREAQTALEVWPGSHLWLVESEGPRGPQAPSGLCGGGRWGAAMSPLGQKRVPVFSLQSENLLSDPGPNPGPAPSWLSDFG